VNPIVLSEGPFHSADAGPNFGRNTMPSLCYKINGQRHCFEIPTLVDLSHIHGPGPVNFPQLELAVTIVGLVHAVEKTRKSELGTKLLEVSNAFLQEVRAGLPQGVELTEDRPQVPQAKSA
jgi:hypothetical protein